MNNLAGAYRAAGRTGDAVPLLEETLSRMKVTLGLGHRDTLNTTDNLANAYQATGRSADAVRMLRRHSACVRLNSVPIIPTRSIQ